jgi:tetratricopeptide (TPR) repeat protein
MNLSACYFDQGQYESAEKYAKATIAIDPNSAVAKYNLGLIYEAANRPYDAIRSFKDSLELDVHQPKLWLALGRLYLKLNRLRDAQKVFELAAKDAPESAEAWEHVGLAAYYGKKYDQAAAAYKKSTEIDLMRASALRGLGVVYMTQFVENRQRTELRDQALAAWNRSLELDSNQPELAQLVKKYTPALTKPAL